MKVRCVYSTSSLQAAEKAVQAGLDAGIAEADISLVARGDVELGAIPENRKEAPTDFKHAAMRGAGVGGATGLLAGLAAVAVPPLGLTLAGVVLTTLGGAAVGTWASSLVGASLPDPIRQKFEDEIKAGRVLVVIDGEGDTLANAEAALRNVGAVHLPYDDPAAMS